MAGSVDAAAEGEHKAGKCAVLRSKDEFRRLRAAFGRQRQRVDDKALTQLQHRNGA